MDGGREEERGREIIRASAGLGYRRQQEAGLGFELEMVELARPLLLDSLWESIPYRAWNPGAFAETLGCVCGFY